jgi:hypothetical protein
MTMIITIIERFITILFGIILISSMTFLLNKVFHTDKQYTIFTINNVLILIITLATDAHLIKTLPRVLDTLIVMNDSNYANTYIHNDNYNAINIFYKMFKIKNVINICRISLITFFISITAIDMYFEYFYNEIISSPLLGYYFIACFVYTTYVYSVYTFLLFVFKCRFIYI